MPGSHMRGPLLVEGAIYSGVTHVGSDADITGGGTVVGLGAVKTGTVAVDPPSINATSRGHIDVTVTGVRAGDLFKVEFNDSINDDLVFEGTAITANDTVTFYFYNPTGSPIDDNSQTWTYLWISMVA